MSSIRRCLTLFLCATPVLLSACGGSGGTQTTSAPTTAVVQGVAASGSPLSGTLSVKDCSFPNRSTNVSINQDGTFSAAVNGMKPPFLLRATYSNISGATRTTRSLYSFASTSGMTNVNPLTNLLVAAAGVTDLYTTNPKPDSMQSVATKLPGLTGNLRTALQPLTSLYGISVLDPFSNTYQFNHQGLDGLFDDVGVTFSNGTMTLANKATGVVFYNALLSDLASGTLQTANANLPTPALHPKPGNARLTLVLSGLPSSGTLVKHLKMTIQLPLGVTVNIDPTGVAAVVNTSIPSGGGTGAVVYPSPSLSATNNQLTIELSSLNGFGNGEFLTLYCIDSFAQLSVIKASDFSIIQAQLYGDIYKQQKIKGGTVTADNLVFPIIAVVRTSQ